MSGRFNGIDEIRIQTAVKNGGEEAQEAEPEEPGRLFGRTGSLSQPLIRNGETGIFMAGTEYTDIEYVPGVGVCGGHGSMKYKLGDEGLPISDRGYHKIYKGSDGRLWGDVGTIHEPVRIVPEGSVRVPKD